MFITILFFYTISTNISYLLHFITVYKLYCIDLVIILYSAYMHTYITWFVQYCLMQKLVRFKEKHDEMWLQKANNWRQTWNNSLKIKGIRLMLNRWSKWIHVYTWFQTNNHVYACLYFHILSWLSGIVKTQKGKLNYNF